MSGSDFAPPPSLANRARRRRTPISLTPLIDVVFILIVFFMLASSFFDWRSIRLDPPAKAGGGGMTGALLVEVRPDGLRLSGLSVTPDQLAGRIADAISLDPDRRVLVRPGEGVSVQDVVAVVDLLAAHGVSRLSLAGGGGR